MVLPVLLLGKFFSSFGGNIPLGLAPPCVEWSLHEGLCEFSSATNVFRNEMASAACFFHGQGSDMLDPWKSSWWALDSRSLYLAFSFVKYKLYQKVNAIFPCLEKETVDDLELLGWRNGNFGIKQTLLWPSAYGCHMPVVPLQETWNPSHDFFGVRTTKTHTWHISP